MVRFYYFLLRLKLFEMFLVNYFARRELMNKLLTDAEVDVKKVCWYWKFVRSVRDSTLLGLNSKKSFSTFNKDIKYWDARDHEQFEIRPIRDPTFQM